MLDIALKVVLIALVWSGILSGLRASARRADDPAVKWILVVLAVAALIASVLLLV